MKEHTHETQIRVRYGETDQMAYVYYGNYAQYFEVARVEWLRSFGLSYKKLEEEGISVSVIHLPTLKPISKKSLLKALGPSKLILTIEEHSILGGLGDAILDTLSDMDYRIFKHGIKDKFPISGKAWDLVSHFKLDAKGIEEKVKNILKA